MLSDREIKVGISEQSYVDIAAGLAAENNKVIISSFATFLTLRALEQIRSFIAYPKLNVTILASHSGLNVGGDGATHSATEDISIMRSIANFTIIQPSDEYTAKAIANYIVKFKGPLYVRLHKFPAVSIHDEGFIIKIDDINLLRSCGNKVVIFFSGTVGDIAIETYEKLEEASVKCSLYEILMIKPLNKKSIISSINDASLIITIEDNNILGGLGSAVAETVSMSKNPKSVLRFGIQDCFGSAGTRNQLYKTNGIDSEYIFNKICEYLKI